MWFRRQYNSAKPITLLVKFVKRNLIRFRERAVTRPLDWIAPATLKARFVLPGSPAATQDDAAEELRIAELDARDRKLAAAKKVVEHRRLERQLRKEIEYYNRVIPNQLNVLGYSYRHVTKGKTKTMLVKFDRIVASEEAIYFHLDIRRLPWGVKLQNLSDPDTLHNLSASCQHSVIQSYRQECGFWYILARGRGVRGVPDEVAWTDIKLHDNAAPLTFRLGMAENKQSKFFDLARAPHLLIGGATDSGKSVFVNQLICTLAERNNPDELKFVMIDLKVVELSFYHGLPHLDRPIVTEKEDVSEVLDELYQEVRRRLNLFRGRCRDIVGWNRLRRSDKTLEFLPYKILVIDEIANLMLDRSLKKKAEEFLSDITAQARATGIHCILCTQRPSVNVVTGLIKANCPTRLAFACASDVDSRVIIDRSDAQGLSPRGRMVFMTGSSLTEIQAPLITDSQVARVVRKLRQGTVAAKRVDVESPISFAELELLFVYARENMNGAFVLDPIFDHFKGNGKGPGIQESKVRYAANLLEEKGYLSSPAGRIPRKVIRWPLSVADFQEIASLSDSVVPMDDPKLNRRDDEKGEEEETIESLTCPACGGDLDPQGRSEFRCEFCGNMLRITP